MPELKLSDQIQSIRELRRRTPQNWMKPFFNKEAGRQFVSKFGLQGPEVYFRFDSIDDLPEVEDLPRSCVVKPVNGNGNRGVFCIKDGWEILDNQPVTRKQILESFVKHEVITNSKVIVEELVTDYSNRRGLPRDFKFYNFGSRCAFIHIVERNHRKDQTKNRHWFLKEDRSPFEYRFISTQRHCKEEIELPSYFDEMLRMAKKISAHMNSFVRVDLYASTDGPVFGELTAFPHGGNGYMEDADVFLGQQWRGYYGGSHLDFVKYFREYIKARLHVR
ncbi:ATP-grasp fold amidoligase family protein [Tropicimonas sp. TH_r6]|uniref:ATP-grasp fold amidoligase family protein n=1 Tax=Tropicimonas sp. TH_r6 TaxID=3082085 RepID=UPI002953336B|nr:ATP-grasp fold amidoligase family protein [Tropicimonas sp. TH_r6]MDV7143432.1 ATP-grasp fold amidoligase family protein [Tropicimonas sp. TH_r6]